MITDDQLDSLATGLGLLMMALIMVCSLPESPCLLLQMLTARYTIF
jgi:hypothetical protein